MDENDRNAEETAVSVSGTTKKTVSHRFAQRREAFEEVAGFQNSHYSDHD